jgi:hypothetical protein
MTNSEIWNAINDELRSAKKAHPIWPDHIASRAGFVVEEAGELMQAALEYKYEKGKKGRNRQQQIDQMKKEAVHTVVTAIRFLENLKQ